MNLYEELTPKQKRIIARDINVVSSLKGLSFPKTIQDIKEIGFFSPKIKVKEKEIYLSEEGKAALRRICDIAHDTKRYRDLLNYNDVFQSVLAELGRWLSDGLIPDADEFTKPLDRLLSNTIKKFHFACRIDGISLGRVASIRIGHREIRAYNNTDLDGTSDASESIKKVIDEEYGGSLVIAGTEIGSQSVALEKFYHNAELSLSIFRLYSCALFQQAIHKVNIRLINNCAHSYGPASCFGIEDSDKSLIFTRYFKSTQDFKLDTELLDHLGRNLFFEDLCSLVDKESMNELENAIVKSLYWIGEAQKDHSNPSAFVKLWSAMECFFTLGDSEITERNARGISSILIFGGFRHEKYEDYEQLKKKIKSYYKLRSKVVHHAEFSHIDDIQLEEMSFVASWVVVAMVTLIKHGYTKLSEIELEVQRLDKMQQKAATGPN